MLLKSNECDMSPWNAMPCCQCCGEFPRAISLVGAESIQGIQPKGMHSPICQCKREALNNSIDLLLGRLESLSFNSYRTPSMFAFMKNPLQIFTDLWSYALQMYRLKINAAVLQCLPAQQAPKTSSAIATPVTCKLDYLFGCL